MVKPEVGSVLPTPFSVIPRGVLPPDDEEGTTAMGIWALICHSPAKPEVRPENEPHCPGWLPDVPTSPGWAAPQSSMKHEPIRTRVLPSVVARGWLGAGPP